MLLPFLDTLYAFTRVVQRIIDAGVIRIKLESFLKSRSGLIVMSQTGFCLSELIEGFFIIGTQAGHLPEGTRGIFVQMKERVCYSHIEQCVSVF